MSSNIPTTKFPLFFSIPCPVEYQRATGRGIDSTVGPEGCLIQYRGTTSERDKIKKAAAALGLTYGSFMRNAVNDLADAVLKHEVLSQEG